MQEFINKIITAIDVVSNGNDFMSVALGSLLLLVLRTVVKTGYDLGLKHLTTVMVVESEDKVYHDMMEYFFKQGMVNHARFININSGFWGHSNLRKSLGEGKHFMYIYDKFCYIDINRTELNNNILFTMTIRYLGRSHSVIDKIRISLLPDPDKKTYKLFQGDKVSTIEIKTDVPMPVVAKDVQTVVNDIYEFTKKEKEYERLGIPYSYGIIFHGEPGTGKTSLLRSLMNGLEYDTYIVNTLEEFKRVPTNGKVLVILEEFDGLIGVDTDDALKNVLTRIDVAKNVSELKKILDGVSPVDGRIILATTNHVELIDGALLRKGRFDNKVEMGLLGATEINELHRRYYGVNFDESLYILKKRVAGAVVQDAFLKGLSNVEFVKQFFNEK